MALCYCVGLAISLIMKYSLKGIDVRHIYGSFHCANAYASDDPYKQNPITRRLNHGEVSVRGKVYMFIQHKTKQKHTTAEKEKSMLMNYVDRMKPERPVETECNL